MRFINKIKLLKKSFYLSLILLSVLDADAQSGIFFQAIARDIHSNPAKERKIYIQSNILSSPTGNKLLTEEHQTNTDAYGIFSILLGNGARVGGSATGLSTIDWAKGPYYLNLKIAITPISAIVGWDYSKEWIDIGNTIFGSVPFALYSASTASIDEKLNVADTTKMLSGYAKAQSLNLLSTIIDSKLSTKDTSLMLKNYAKISYIDSILLIKMNLFDTSRYTKITYTDSALLTKLNITGSAASLTNFPTLNQNTTGNAATSTYANIANIAYTAIIAANITATSNTTLNNLASLNSIGTITSGVWSATTIDIAHGGTGLTSPGIPGQLLTSTAIGTLTWTSTASLTGAHFLGENYGGGIVFYVYDNGKHGLIIATEDQSTGVNASTFSSATCCLTTNAIRDGINAGMSNTERIIINQGSGNYAAFIATNYKGGGYGDWYLPSIAEMKLIILNSQYIMSTFINPLDQYKMYWSSNENPANNKQNWANFLIVDSGNYYAKYGNPSIKVRAIRAF